MRYAISDMRYAICVSEFIFFSMKNYKWIAFFAVALSLFVNVASMGAIIISLKEIDGLLIGPYDLSASLGMPGNFESNEFIHAIDRFEKLCLESKKNIGFHLPHPNIEKYKSLTIKVLDWIEEEFKKNSNETLYLRADFKLSYGKVAALMSRLKKGGIASIALVTEVKNERGKK